MSQPGDASQGERSQETLRLFHGDVKNQSVASARQVAQIIKLDALDADLLIAHVLGKTRTYLFTWPEKTLTEAQCSQLAHLLSRRQAGEPIAYLLGEREFWSLPISTAPSTLIPRPDTEVLVETVLANVETSARVCMDLGTGTGAIALALKTERPQWQISGVDRVADAVALAQLNARKLALNVSFSQADWLSGVKLNSVDVIVTNPPYIDAQDPHLKQGDVRFEPLSALVADKNGMADIELIAQQSAEVLKAAGGLFIEHGWQQANEVRQVLWASGFERIESVRDYAGHERVTFGFKA